MLVPLAAVKQYLRIDGDEEDDLLTHFTETAEQICTALLRVKKLSKVENQAIVHVAILYAVSCVSMNIGRKQITEGLR